MGIDDVTHILAVSGQEEGEGATPWPAPEKPS
jgi:hypothetical protein